MISLPFAGLGVFAGSASECAEQRGAAGRMAGGRDELDRCVENLGSVGQRQSTQLGGVAAIAEQPAKVPPLLMRDGRRIMRSVLLAEGQPAAPRQWEQ